MRTLRAAMLVAAIFCCLSAVRSAQAATPPNTSITNSASATYQDSGGNSYQTQSNIVTITVQNAPSLTNAAGTGANYAPGQIVTDTYTLVNTGNASGDFQLTADAALGGTDAASATLGDGGTACGGSPCEYAVTIGGTTTKYATYAALNTYLASQQIAIGSSVVVSAYYTLATTAPAGSGKTVSSTVTATITQAAVGSATAETSAAQSATETNDVLADARLDLYKTSAQNGTTGDITYTIYANNGGQFGAKDLLSAQTLLGAATPGVLIGDRVPQFGGVPLALANSGAVSVTSNATHGFASGAVADLYYSTSPNGSTGWIKATSNLPTNGSVTYIAVFIHGGSCGVTAGFELCSDPGTTPGTVSVSSQSAVTLSFVVAPPAGAGAGNAGSVSNIADGVIGDNQSTEHILGPGIPGGTADSASGTALTVSGEGINYTGAIVPGASNTTSNSALSQYGVLNGPLGFPGSSGSYDGVAAPSTNDDFTAFPFGVAADNVQNTSTTPGTPATAAKTGAAVTLCVPNELQNSGNLNDDYNITANVPTAYPIPATSGGTAVTGWTVGVYSDSACSAALGGATDGSSSATASNVAVASGATLTYYVKFIVPIATAYFDRFDALVHAVSVGSSAQTNDTHDELYSGFVALTKSETIVSSGCPSGVSQQSGTFVCPGGVISYTVDYRNLVMGTSDNTQSFASATTKGGTFVVDEDGTTAIVSSTTQNNWATFASAITQPTDTTAGGVFTYYTGIPVGSGTGTFAASDTKFTDQVGGASFQLVPHQYNGGSFSSTQGWQGAITFTVTVK